MHVDGRQFVADQAQRPGRRQARPGREVGRWRGRRPGSSGGPARRARRRRTGPRRVRHPVVEEGEGGVAAAVGTAADQADGRGVQQHVRRRLRIGGRRRCRARRARPRSAARVSGPPASTSGSVAAARSSSVGGEAHVVPALGELARDRRPEQRVSQRTSAAATRWMVARISQVRTTERRSMRPQDVGLGDTARRAPGRRAAMPADPAPGSRWSAAPRPRPSRPVGRAAVPGHPLCRDIGSGGGPHRCIVLDAMIGPVPGRRRAPPARRPERNPRCPGPAIHPPLPDVLGGSSSCSSSWSRWSRPTGSRSPWPSGAAGKTMQSSQHLDRTPSVSVAGFPFLTQLATGHFGTVEPHGDGPHRRPERAHRAAVDRWARTCTTCRWPATSFRARRARPPPPASSPIPTCPRPSACRSPTPARARTASAGSPRARR